MRIDKVNKEALFKFLFIVFFVLSICGSISAQNAARGMVKVIPPVPELSGEAIGYGQSWALVIGIDEYKDYPKLRTAVRGARAFAQKLKEEFGFPEDHVIELYNQEATKQKIEYYLKDFFVQNATPDDRLLIYFGGHGDTYQERIGYLCPYDAQKQRLTITGVSMNDLRELNQIISAKHIFYIFDCCFSGMAFARGGIGDLPPNEQDYYKKLLTKKTRQVLTAGQSNELALDVGPGGKYSPFTYFLLEALESQEVKDDFNIIQASRIGQYVKEKVGRYTGGKQTPIIDRFPDSEQGDFLLWKEEENRVNFPSSFLQFSNGSQTQLDKLIDYQVKTYGRKNFLIVFWDSYCVPCLHEIKALSSLSFPGNFLIITINLDDPESTRNFTLAKNFIKDYELSNFVNLFLTSSSQKIEFLQKFKFNATPLTILIDERKNIRMRKAGYDYQLAMGKNLLYMEILKNAVR
ncbi:MAG: hypothetical protein GXO77_13850 [Calditrichaeota bacterium]|nr:hypothetical protein [Calditrichota bacterium]